MCAASCLHPLIFFGDLSSDHLYDILTFFVSCSAVQEFDTAEHFETAPELVGRKFNRPRVKDLESGQLLHGATDRKSLKVCVKCENVALLGLVSSWNFVVEM